MKSIISTINKRQSTNNRSTSLNQFLFNSTTFHYYKHYDMISIEDRIDQLQKPDFDDNSLEILSFQILSEFSKDFPKVKYDDIYMGKPQDITLSVNKKIVEGTRITLFIPFKGDGSLLQIFPSVQGIENCSVKDFGELKDENPLPYGEIEENTIKVVYDIPYSECNEKVKQEFENNLKLIQLHLKYLNCNFKSYREELTKTVNRRLQKRLGRLNRDIEIANSFGFPIK